MPSFNEWVESSSGLNVIRITSNEAFVKKNSFQTQYPQISLYIYSIHINLELLLLALKRPNINS